LILERIIIRRRQSFRNFSFFLSLLSLIQFLTEFMALWDGIRRGPPSRRVLVLGATNRPADLDEAVLRRFTARVHIGLPDAAARREVLASSLGGERLAPGLDLAAVAAATEGYSGADLKQLCVAAAMRPVRELLAEEEKREELEKAPHGETACEGGRKESVVPVGTALLDPGSVGPFGELLHRVEAVGAARGGREGLRPIIGADFDAARAEMGPSVDPDSASARDLAEWNAKFGTTGRGGAADRRERLSYFM
jgi:SpoVK/Ycf46/Vps4 family AAA+-type ATPase